MGKRWLNGGRGSGNNGVSTRNYIDCDYRQSDPAKYQWIARSESGDGSIHYQYPKAGECVMYNDKIFFRINELNNMWLTGGRGASDNNVSTRNYLDGGYEQSDPAKY